MNERVALLLMDAAKRPREQRRSWAAAVRRARERGLSARAAVRAVAIELDVEPSLLAACSYGGVWTCEACERDSFQLRGGQIVYLDGAPAAACCRVRGKLDTGMAERYG